MRFLLFFLVTDGWSSAPVLMEAAIARKRAND